MAQKQGTSGARVDRRRIRTRAALISAGERLFSEKPIDKVTINEISEAADVAKSSFYNYFDDKEQLSETIVEMVVNDCWQESNSANIDVTEAPNRIVRATTVFIRYAAKHPYRYRAMVSISRQRPDIEARVNADLRHDIEAGLETGQFSGITVQGGMLAVVNMVSTAMDYLTASHASESAGIAKEVALMLLRALGLPSKRALSISEKAVDALFHAAPSSGEIS